MVDEKTYEAFVWGMTDPYESQLKELGLYWNWEMSCWRGLELSESQVVDLRALCSSAGLKISVREKPAMKLWAGPPSVRGQKSLGG